LGIGTNLISEAGPTRVFGLCQGPKRKERLGKEWYYRVLIGWCWRTCSHSNARIVSSRDVVLEELSIHKGYQQMDEGTERSMLSFGERKSAFFVRTDIGFSSYVTVFCLSHGRS